MSSKTAEMGERTTTTNNAEPSPSGDSIPLMNGSFDSLLTPELLYKMNKKIAQLTKVVYGLNTRGEELEGQLQVAKESEEKAKAQTLDLQLRMNTFKTKIENEMGKLRDLEAQAKQAQIWKMECDNLRRRLESGEGLPDGGGAALNHAREEVEQGRRREAALQFELDQARHAINNLKAHHDFIMRERDAQQVMESEKVVLEWQSRMAELEGRYKVQTRRLTEDIEVLRAECEMLRGRVFRSSSSNAEEGALREQMRMLQVQHDSERREWEIKWKRQNDEMEEETRKLTDEKFELMRKVRDSTEEKEEQEENWEEQLRLTKEKYEERIRDLTSNQDLLQRLVDDKEEEFERKLKAKVAEWKAEWDLAEEGLQEEIRKLKSENLRLQTECTSLRFSLDNAGLSFIGRIQKLEDEVADKTNEIELKTKNFKVRVGMVENESRQYLEERKELEKALEEERERFKAKLKNQETISENMKDDLQNRLEQLRESEKVLKEAHNAVEEENELLRKEKDDLLRKIKEKDWEYEERLEHEVKIAETRVKQRMERVWLEKLRRAEETAACDIERVEDERKRREISLKRGLEEAQSSEEELKTLNEELKQKLKESCQRVVEKSEQVRGVEAQLREIRKRGENISFQQHVAAGTVMSGMESVVALQSESRYAPISRISRKELAEQERKYQNQIDELTMKLAEKQQEVVDLVQELTEARQKMRNSSQEDNLLLEVENMKKQLKLKENTAESYKVELQYVKNENDIAKLKIQRLEDDLKRSKDLVSSLQEQSCSRARDSSRLKETEDKARKLEEDLKKSESVRKDLQNSLNEIEAERDEELKIVQDALDEAAQEREELIMTFEKELKHLNSTNTTREQQMMEDFEWKLREMEKDHKKKLEEKERQLENTLHRVKCHNDEEEFRHRLERMKNEINAKWEDKLRSECSRLKSELDDLHSEEKHLAVESMKVQKEQEMQALKKSWELSQEEMTKEISTLKDRLTEKDAYYHKELESQRTIADRDIWDLRMKLQRLTESSFDKQQQLEEKYREDMERFRIDHDDRIRELESRLATREAQAGIDLLGQLEKEHKNQMQHLEEQHRLSMERLREELESDKFQAVEEARVIITKHHECVVADLKEQIKEYMSTISQCREEVENLRQTVTRREETLRSLREELERYQESRGRGDSYPNSDSPPSFSPSASSGLSSSQYSLASSSDSQGSQGSRTSQDRFYLPENTGVLDNSEDSQRVSNTGILGKMFGGGWFAPTKGKDGGRRGGTPLSNKKVYGS